MAQLDIVSIIIVVAFLIPILYGVFNPITKYKLQFFIGSLFDSLEFLGALFLSVFLTGKVFFGDHGETGRNLYGKIYHMLPAEVKNALYGQGALTYIVAVPVILLLLLLVFRIVTTPLYRIIIEPAAGLVYDGIDRIGIIGRALLGALWRLPKALCLLLILGLGVNLYTYYVYSPELTRMLNESPAYQALYRTAISPVLNSSIAKRIPVIVNDSFDKSATPEEEPDASVAEKLVKQLTGKNRKVIEYFNGVTLDEAIKSTPEIDQTAIKVVGNEKSTTKKAYLLYKWVSQNISYDYDKAQKLSTNPQGISSGTIDAFTTRKGVCFDYSSLYISMCQAVGLKVRLVTGLGYSGLSWGDHAWNQVYSMEENRWLHVDTTFGTASNYFDKPDFHMDHKYDEVQGEW